MKTSVLTQRHEEVIQTLETSQGLFGAYELYGPKRVDMALGFLATLDRPRYFNLMGSAYSEREILLDNCVGGGMVEPVRAEIGQPLVLGAWLAHDATDREIFYECRNQGVSAIMTRDGAEATHIDLCKIASDAYRKFHKNNDQRPVPAIVILPQGYLNALNVLKARIETVRDYIFRHENRLQNDAAYILDLRPSV